MAEMAEHWHIGYNLAGYLPESDVICVRGTWRDAAETFAAEVRDYASRDDDAAWDVLTSYSADELRTMGYAVFPDENGHLNYENGVDFGDDEPAMRAEVDGMTADGDLIPREREGQGLGVILTDNDDRPISFWLVPSDEDCAEDGTE